MERGGGNPMYFGYLRGHQGQRISGTWTRMSMSDSDPGPPCCHHHARPQNPSQASVSGAAAISCSHAGLLSTPHGALLHPFPSPEMLGKPGTPSFDGNQASETLR